MLEKPSLTRAETAPTNERSSASLLVRCWLEPTGIAGEPPALRGYVKNLKTGEETFFKDLEAISHQIRRQLEGDALASPPTSLPANSTRAAGR